MANQAGHIDQMLNLVYVLLALAVFIALLGIANTLGPCPSSSGPVSSGCCGLGMTREQVRSTVRWESVVIALLGTSVGLAIGLIFGWALVESLEAEGINTLAVPGGQLATVVVGAGLAGVAAARSRPAGPPGSTPSPPSDRPPRSRNR